MFTYKLLAILRETPKAMQLRIENKGDIWLPRYLIERVDRDIVVIKENAMSMLNHQAIHNQKGFNPDNSWRYITVFSDASFKNGIYGAGVWIKYTNNQTENVTKTLLLGLNGECRTNTQAEEIALQTGLDFVMQVLKPPTSRIIVLQSDCQSALQKIQKPDDRNVYCKWVKGHQGGRNARSWVNELCDRVATDMRVSYPRKVMKFNPETPRDILLNIDKYS